MKSIVNNFYIHFVRRFLHDIKILVHGEQKQKVNFLICGTQKGGTTALDTYLRNHPEICMASHKEVHFFDREKYFLYDKPDYSQYISSFKPGSDHIILGETTPIYMDWYTAPRRIWEYNPDMKLIILLRNPIDRAFSHWNMQRERGFDTLPFLEAIQEEEKRRRLSLPWQNRRHSYLDRGFYSEQIKRLLAFFPKEQMLIMKSEELRDGPQWMLNKICQFIGVSRMENVEDLNRHTRSYNSSMNPKEFLYLKQVYTLEIKNIEQITGWDCQDWLVRN